MEAQKLIKYVFLALSLIIAWGTFGYMLIEGVDFFEALYMTVITVTTVGYGEIITLSKQGRVFTILLIIFGVGGILVTFGVLTQIAVEGSLRRIVGRKRMENQIRKLRGHYIICGAGRVGNRIINDLMEQNVPLVVIDHDPHVTEDLIEKGFLVITDKATEEDVLEKANIRQAKGLVVTVSSDAESVFIILTARNINPKLFILTRAIEENNYRKLLQAGANRVISAYALIGKRMSNAILRPAVHDMIDNLLFAPDLDLAIEGTEVYSNSSLAGKSLRDSGIRQKLGLIIIGVQKGDGNLLFNPSPDEILEPGDSLISIGDKDSIRRLADWLIGKTNES